MSYLKAGTASTLGGTFIASGGIGISSKSSNHTGETIKEAIVKGGLTWAKDEEYQGLLTDLKNSGIQVRFFSLYYMPNQTAQSVSADEIERVKDKCNSFANKNTDEIVKGDVSGEEVRDIKTVCTTDYTVLDWYMEMALDKDSIMHAGIGEDKMAIWNNNMISAGYQTFNALKTACLDMGKKLYRSEKNYQTETLGQKTFRNTCILRLQATAVL